MRRQTFCLAGLIAATAPARAETAASFRVSASVSRGCRIVTDDANRLGSIDLGSVAGLRSRTVEGALISAAGAGVSVECTPGVSASLSADKGEHPSGGERQLKLTTGLALIPYRLFADGQAAPWTDALPLPSGGRRLIPVRAVATLAGPAVAGTYTDTVRVTLSW